MSTVHIFTHHRQILPQTERTNRMTTDDLITMTGLEIATCHHDIIITVETADSRACM
jgi:hypothetical protein